MSRTSIDFGIHLGSSHSAIAVLEGTQVRVIKNNDGSDLTPCAVHIDKNDHLSVGRLARTRLDTEPEDACTDFRYRMGTGYQFHFQKSGRVMRPEELTAEVIKSLAADVRQRMGEELQAAVITVPAAFEPAQCQATKEAARLAGLKTCRLIMEPVAAAMAYASKNNPDEGYWLVYDFLGSSFSATLLKVRGDNPRILHQTVDHDLGISQIDWEVIEKLLVPAIVSINPLTDFQRGNPRWRKPFMKLKREVEEAELQLAQKDSWVILFDYLCNDDNGEPVAFEFELKRRDFDRMIDPYIQRIIQSSRQFLEDRLLDSSDVSKLIYVGDPALVPFLRPPFAHPNQGLGLTLEDSIDPWTVLAQGAAVLAGSTSIEDESAEEWTKGRRFQVTVQGQEPGALQEKEPAPSFQSQAPVDLQVKEPAPGSQGQGLVESVEEELMPVPEGQAAGALSEEEPSPGSQAQEAEVLSMEEPVLVSEEQEAGVLPVEESTPTSQDVEPPNPPVLVETAVLAPELPGLVMCQCCGEQVEIVEIGELIYCVNCGVVLPDPQAQSKRDQEIAITSTQTRCFFCTLNVFPVHIGGKYYCPECGIELKI